MERFNLGQHTRPVSTNSVEAQRWFDLGINWCFGFNFGEGRKCFEKALEFDPECVMAHWGVAYGSSPFYNLTGAKWASRRPMPVPKSLTSISKKRSRFPISRRILRTGS